MVTAAYLVQPNQSSSSNDAAIAEVIGSAAPVNHTSLQVSRVLLLRADAVLPLHLSLTHSFYIRKPLTRKPMPFVNKLKTCNAEVLQLYMHPPRQRESSSKTLV